MGSSLLSFISGEFTPENQMRINRRRRKNRSNLIDGRYEGELMEFKHNEIGLTGLF